MFEEVGLKYSKRDASLTTRRFKCFMLAVHIYLLRKPAESFNKGYELEMRGNSAPL